MIRLTTNLPALYSEICEVVRLFLGEVAISPDAGEEEIRHAHGEQDGRFIERFEHSRGLAVTHEAQAAPSGAGRLQEKKLLKRAVKTGCFLLMRALTGSQPPWGSLTGIRPTRVLYEMLDSGLAMEEAKARLARDFYVSPEKADLLGEIHAMQAGFLPVPADECDVYIGIPFCTTRCAYCSFASGELGDGSRVPAYLAALSRELRAAAALLAELSLTARAVYVGGGTPTALPADALDELLNQARVAFPGARERTVEAGRPDTIDRAKLLVMKRQGTTRISVNPQSFSDRTLARIGRAHTARDTLAAFELARAEGFDDINMDLIAALPGEDMEAFARSVEQAVDLFPENVTVHTLAIKRGSALHERGLLQAAPGLAAAMVAFARARLAEAGYRPYYLYRQKYMAGNLENVGYALPNRACLYNIDNMEESTRILALGAGAITKWLFPRERRIERAPNVRNIEEYVSRVDEMIARKRALILGEEDPRNKGGHL